MTIIYKEEERLNLIVNFESNKEQLKKKILGYLLEDYFVSVEDKNKIVKSIFNFIDNFNINFEYPEFNNFNNEIIADFSTIQTHKLEGKSKFQISMELTNGIKDIINNFFKELKLDYLYRIIRVDKFYKIKFYIVPRSAKMIFKLEEAFNKKYKGIYDHSPFLYGTHKSNDGEKILIKCKKCGWEHETYIDNILSDRKVLNCGGCNENINYENELYSDEEFANKFYNLVQNRKYKIISKYNGMKSDILVQCTNCGQLHIKHAEAYLNIHRTNTCSTCNKLNKIIKYNNIGVINDVTITALTMSNKELCHLRNLRRFAISRSDGALQLYLLNQLLLLDNDIYIRRKSKLQSLEDKNTVE